ncbi:MAG: malate dehydrogenase [Actinomycetota bacterium]
MVERGMADVCLIDVIEGWPQGLALDLSHSAPIQRFEVRVTGANDYKKAAGAHVVVVTAGLARTPGMSRLDLANSNKAIIEKVAAEVAEHCPEAVVVVVTNPLDEMTYWFAEKSGFPKQRVMGMAGLLDSARLCSYIAEELKVSPLSVDAITLGSHGEDMVPLPRLATVDGRPLTELLDESALKSLFERTVGAGAEVVSLLGNASAFYAPSAAVAKMVNAITGDSKEVLPVSAWVTGQYGVNETYLGVPARLGRKGVEEIIELDLDDQELGNLKAAANAISKRCVDLQAG